MGIETAIAFNIALGEKDINESLIINSLKKANAWEFIKELPGGIKESVMERGARFSGGQRQRLALARALYRKPKILILDEPTSGLDKKSEELMISTIKELKGKITILLITHKESVAKGSDNVYFLARGNLSTKEETCEIN